MNSHKYNEKWERNCRTINTTEIQRIIRDYYEKFYVNKLDKLEEIDKFLETMSQDRDIEGIENMNRLTTNWISNHKTPKKQKSGTGWLQGELRANI